MNLPLPRATKEAFAPPLYPALSPGKGREREKGAFLRPDFSPGKIFRIYFL
jgi:hypothetical protein